MKDECRKNNRQAMVGCIRSAFIQQGQSGKTLDQIETELDAIEYLCRPYVDSDDIENSPFHLEEEYITMK